VQEARRAVHQVVHLLLVQLHVEVQRRAGEREEELTVQGYQLEAARRALENITGSASWRMTSPLRAAKRQASRVKG